MLNLTQLTSIRGFLYDFEKACVENGIAPETSFDISVSNGLGGAAPVRVVPVTEGEDEWSLAVVEPT